MSKNMRIKTLLIWMNIAIIVAGVLAFFGGAFDDSSPTGVRALSSEKITSMPGFLAPEVCMEFKSNKIRAEQEWNGKIAKITGQIEHIAVDVFGYPFILLDCNPVMPGSVRFVLPKDGKAELSKLSVGEFVTGVGIFKSAVLYEIWLEDVLIINKGL